MARRLQDRIRPWCNSVCAFTTVCVLLASLGCTAAGERMPQVEAISVRELHRLIDGERGKVILVNAWASWCAPCRKEMPDLVKLHREFADEDVRLVLLSADESEILGSVVRPTLQKLGVDFPSYVIDEQSDAAFIEGMSPDWSGALPTTFVYDRRGELVEMLVGERTYEQFRSIVVRLLEE